MKLSPASNACLLLTCPLLNPSGTETVKVLTPAKFHGLLEELSQKEIDLGELATQDFERKVLELSPKFDHEQIIALLERGFQLSQTKDLWSRQDFWVTTQFEESYPKKLAAKLLEKSPPYIVGIGNRESLDSLNLGVVGSRDLMPDQLAIARETGRIAANENVPVVSGFARGADQASMFESLSFGGRAIGVLADKLSKIALLLETREWIHNDQLTLVTTFDPYSQFSVGNAMQRNKYIYAFSEAVLVVEAKNRKGGTWAGAEEQLKTLHCAPVYVDSRAKSEGVSALRGLGALDLNLNDLRGNVRDFLKKAKTEVQESDASVSKTGQLGLF